MKGIQSETINQLPIYYVKASLNVQTASFKNPLTAILSIKRQHEFSQS